MPGMTRFRGNGWHASSTAILGSFDGVYDPVGKHITGTFQYNQERIYLELYQFGQVCGTDEYTQIEVSGTFTMAIYTPVILIPGWAHAPNVWRNFAQFLRQDFADKPWATELGVDGRFRSPFEEVEPPQHSDPNTNAQILAIEIETIKEKRGWTNTRIDLVAHSQGGLDARAYLHTLGDKAKDQVRSLTMIATPNHGTVLAYLAGVRYLTPRWVEAFNKGTPRTPGVTYYTVAGSKVGPLSWLLRGEDDGIVPVSSVHLDYANVLGCSPDTSTCPYEHNELVTRREVYDTIKNQMDPDFAEEPNSLAFVAIRDDNVLIGQPVSETVVVDAVKEVAFVIASPTSLGFTLQSPTGEHITPQTQNARVSYYSGEGLGLLAQSYVVRQPATGAWMAHVSGGAELQHFTLLVSAENTFALDGSTDEYFNHVGEEVRLRATLDVDATIASMWADITDPNGSREIVDLYDDGLHEDGSPKDGVYGNAFFPSVEGEYTIVFSSRGAIGGKEFSRIDLESIFVNAPTMPAR
jgi:pimeloyl-ACP methyl ester carboxylesterase